MTTTIEDLESQKSSTGSTSPIRLSHATGGNSVPVIFGKKALNQTTQNQFPHTAVHEVQSENDFSNNQMGKYLKSVRNQFGKRSIEAGAEKALQGDSKLVEDFFVTESFNFEVTDPDDKKNTLTVSKTGVICKDVPSLTKFLNEKRGFDAKIKLNADSGGNTMKVSANFQKPINIPDVQEIVEDISDNDQNVKNDHQSDDNIRKSARSSTSSIQFEDESESEMKMESDSDYEAPASSTTRKK